MVWIYADLLPFWGGDIDAKVKVHRKHSGSALLSISGISHETKNFSGLHSIAGSKIFLIGGKMRIIKISARVRTDTNSVSAKRQPAFLFNNAVCDTDDGIIAGLADGTKEIGSFMMAISTVCT